MHHHEDQVAQITDDIQMPANLRAELACLALHLDEPWVEVLSEALSEYRSLRNVGCDAPACAANEEQRDALGLAIA